jgi:predicted ABC-type ATPase
VIARPNGAGETTFALEFLPQDAGVVHFVNADLIAAGLSPFRPARVALSAGRLLLRELDRLAATGEDFAFESTLSGLSYAPRLHRWRIAGYRVEIVFLRLVSSELAWRRVAERVRQGGHDVRRADVLRRFERGWRNFERVYRPLADSWAVYDNSGPRPVLVEKQ